MANKVKLSTITVSDFEKFKTDLKGDCPVPDGFEVYKTPTKAERLQARLTEIEKELAGMSVPDDKDLVDFARGMHPYYMLTDELGWLKKELGIKEAEPKIIK